MIATAVSVVAQIVVLRRQLGRLELGRFVWTTIRVTPCRRGPGRGQLRGLVRPRPGARAGADRADRLARGRARGRRPGLRGRDQAAVPHPEAHQIWRLLPAAAGHDGLLGATRQQLGAQLASAGQASTNTTASATKRRPRPLLGILIASSMDRIRNFSIIAHIDHGKSTLADRFLELTGAVDRGAPPAAARLDGPRARARDHDQGAGGAGRLRGRDGQTYHLHLIDTPGHVDFSYEVSRSLAACEGALLVVDASQGVEAQTVANTYAAVEAGLELIPVLNKVDLPSAEPERVAAEITDLIGRRPRRDPADLGQDRRGRGRTCSRRSSSGSRRPRATRSAAAGADLRLRVRPVPRRGRLRPARGRRVPQAGARSSRCRPAPRPTSTRSASSRPR